MDEERKNAVTEETGTAEQGTEERAGGFADRAGDTADSAAAADGAAVGAEALREELSRAQERVTQLERERVLLSQGVPEEDLDYYVFKIGKLVSGEKDFDTAAKEYLKQHAAAHRGSTPRSTGASLSGRTARAQSTNDTMNKLLRGV